MLNNEKPSNENDDHLVVLSHGLLGTRNDLGYLSENLKSFGCNVLESSVNENFNSLFGVKSGGLQLADEVVNIVSLSHNKYKRISFVGNSLGGLYARYAIKSLYNPADKTVAGLIPQYFITIATPHLGVRNFTFFELPDRIKVIVSSLFLATGKDLFLNDNIGTSTLLYEMATSEEFLVPLKSFALRRLYANLFNDFVVPLGTGAFLNSSEVTSLRQAYTNQLGIVKKIFTEKIDSTDSNQQKVNEEIESSDTSSNTILQSMIHSLNRCGWEKVIVSFPGYLPIAHNKICALTRKPDFITQSLLGFSQGRFVMDDATSLLAG